MIVRCPWLPVLTCYHFRADQKGCHLQCAAAANAAFGIAGCTGCPASLHCALSGGLLKIRMPFTDRCSFVLCIQFQNLPHSILKNIFSCWKGLIDVYLLPNKNCGYVKYSERESAQKAIGVLNGAEICGTKIKVCTQNIQNKM